MRNWSRSLILGFVLALFGGCAEPGANTRGVYMLLDTSGTYTQELEKAEQIINFVLAKLNPGDSFTVARINTGSFTEKNIVAKVILDDRPSRANQEKRLFSEQVNRFVKGVEPSQYTDITGGLLQAAEFLAETGAARKTILVFSDLEEDLAADYERDIPLEMDDVEAIALNVTKLRSDNLDPRRYMDRLAEWQQKVQDGGGSWRVVNDLERLDSILAD